jgi:hypothetical protein
MSASGLVKWLILMALLFAPLAMIGDSPAAAHVRPAASGHCAEGEKPAEAPPAAPADCMIACAVCLPTQGGVLAVLPRLESATRPAAVAFCLHGLHPEAATPPPRFS